MDFFSQCNQIRNTELDYNMLEVLVLNIFSFQEPLKKIRANQQVFMNNGIRQEVIMARYTLRNRFLKGNAAFS